MAITISGTTGVAGVDGSASAPSLIGTDSNSGVYFGADVIKFSTGGTERMSITNSGVTGAGVTQTVGSWAPTDASGAGLSFSTAVGRYILTGKICTVFCHTVWPSSTSSAQVTIGGLPATVKNQSGDTSGWDFTGGSGRVSVQGPNVNYDMTARGVKNTTTVKIWGSRGDGGSGYAYPNSVQGANSSGSAAAGGILQFSLTYEVD